MRTLAALCLFTTSLFGGKAYVQADNTARSVIIPASYSSLAEHSETMRFRTGSVCQTTGGNNIYLGFGFGLGCGNASFTTITFWPGLNGVPPQILATAADGVEQNTWYFISMQRTLTKLDVVMHRMDGSVVAKKSITTAGWSRTTGTQHFFRGGGVGTGNQGFAFAHMCWYSALLASDADAIPAPPDGACESSNKLQGWAFEDDLYSDDRAMNLTGSSASPTFEVAPAFDPVIQFAISGATAGGKAILDATRSFYFVPAGQSTPPQFSHSDFIIQQLSGPSQLYISNPREPLAEIRNWVAGKYVIQLAVANYPPRVQTVNVLAKDLQGLAIAPNNTARQARSIAFLLSDVTDAVDVQVEVRRPDGGMYPPVTCVSSPCTIYVDGRQNDHLFRVAYRNAEGSVIAKSDWQLLTNTANVVDTPAAPTVSYARQGAMIKYVTSSETMQALPFTLRTVDQYFGSGLYMQDVDVLQANATGRNIIYSVYSDLATYSNFQDLQIFQDTPELGSYSEKALGHVWVNYDMAPVNGSRASAVWSERERFGIEESTNTLGGTSLQNGVVLAGSSTCPAGCSDRSAAAYDGNPADVMMSATYPYMLIGYGNDFDEVNLNISTPQTGCAVTWEYWNGSSWASLSLDSDGTESGGLRLKQSGRVRFTPPADWVKSRQSGQFAKPWIRVGAMGCSMYPVFSRIYGDNWREYEMPAKDRRMWSGTMLAAADGEQFNSITMNVSVRWDNLSPVWEYSLADGTWAALPAVADGTNNFKNTGAGTVSWTIPGNWAKYDHSGSGVAKKWIRVSGTGTVNTATVSTFTIGGGTTTAAISTAAGRGWDPTAPGVIRAGTNRAYNPNPPAHATARFEYQARTLVSFWSKNAAGYNLTAMAPDGLHRAASYVFLRHFEYKEAIHGGRHNAYFLDNIAHDHGPDKLASPSVLTDGINADHSTGTNAHEGWLKDFVSLVAERHPTIKVGGNGTSPNMTHCKTADFCIEEGFFNYSSVSSLGFKDVWDSVMDPMATNNPRSTTVATLCADLNDRPSVGTPSTTMFWDRSNRGPMVCLSGYYQGANEYTRFGHSPSSPWAYTETTEVWLRGAPAQVGTEVTPASTQICSDTFATLPVSAAKSYRYFAEGSGMFNLVKRSEGSCMAFQTAGVDQVITNLNAGDSVYLVTVCQLGTCVPKLSEGVIAWGWNFPAMGADVGVPLASRAIYRDAASAGTKRDVYWRPYTNAVVMTVLAAATDQALEDYNSRSDRTINFADAGWCSGAGCRLYPLRADGYTDNSVCSVSERTSDGGCTGYSPWRAGDGQIFMREPIQ